MFDSCLSISLNLLSYFALIKSLAVFNNPLSYEFLFLFISFMISSTLFNLIVILCKFVKLDSLNWTVRSNVFNSVVKLFTLFVINCFSVFISVAVLVIDSLILLFWFIIIEIFSCKYVIFFTIFNRSFTSLLIVNIFLIY